MSSASCRASARRRGSIAAQSSSAFCSVGAMPAPAPPVSARDSTTISVPSRPPSFSDREFHCPPLQLPASSPADATTSRSRRTRRRRHGATSSASRVSIITATSSVAVLPPSLSMFLKRLGMRAVREAAGMQRHHAGMDVVAAEEIARVIEDHLVVIVVVVEERHLSAPGSVSNGRGTKVQTTKRSATNVVCAEGGR